MYPDTPKLILVSGAPHTGASAFADSLIERYPEMRFHCLTQKALEAMVIAGNIVDADQVRMSDRVYHRKDLNSYSYESWKDDIALSPDEYIRKCKARDEVLWPITEAWFVNEMSRGYNVIVEYNIDPDVTDIYYGYKDVVPVVFLNTRPAHEQFEQLRALRDSTQFRHKLTELTLFDDEQLMRYAEASRQRDLKLRYHFIDDLVSFEDLNECDSIAEMRDNAYAKLDKLFGNEEESG